MLIEKARRLARVIVPKRLYASFSHVLNYTLVFCLEGPRTLLSLTAESRETLRSVKLRRIPFPIWFRPGSPDAHAIIQNLVRQEYGNLPGIFDCKTILDAGAYIGDTSIFFLNRFPESTVVTLEPDSEAYEIALKNLASYNGRSIAYNYALWGIETELYLEDCFVNRRTSANAINASPVRAVTVQSICKQSNLNHFELVKLDVEGAEESIIDSNSLDWLDSVKLLIVEFHGDRIQNKCLEILSKHNFHCWQYRSLHYFLKNTVLRDT